MLLALLYILKNAFLFISSDQKPLLLCFFLMKFCEFFLLTGDKIKEFLLNLRHLRIFIGIWNIVIIIFMFMYVFQVH